MAFERNNRSIVLRQRELQRRFGIRPTKDTIKSIHRNMIEHQRLTLETPGPSRTVTTPTNIRRVLELAEEHERRDEPTSTRRLALELAEEGRGMSHTTVHQVLRTQGFTGYHERRVHELLPEDYPRRVEMARTLLRMMDEDPTLIEKIIWTDEAKFTLSGAVNSHITIYWSRTNPHRTRETRRVDQRGVMVWVGMHANGIDGTLTGAKYHDLLEQQILPNIDTSGHWWMQDGAPAHGTRVVKDLLSSFFDERVIALG